MHVARTRTHGSRFHVLAVIVLIGVVLLLLLLWPAPQTPALNPAAPPPTLKHATTTDQLIAAYEERVRVQPEHVQSYALLGVAYLQRVRETGDPSDYARAETALAQALRRDPQHIDALVGKGTLLLAQHRFTEALAVGEQTRSIAPRVPRVYGIIADAHTELGQYDAAVTTIQTMVDMRPDLSSYTRVAYARELHGDLAGAISAMTAAVRAGGPTPEATEWTRVQLGNLYLATGDLPQAEARYIESLGVIDGYAPALAGLAHVRVAQGQFDHAIDLYQQAITRMPLAEYVIALGELHLARGDTVQAEQQFALVRAMQQLQQAAGVDVDLELALFEADHGDPQAAAAQARSAYARRPSVKAADTLAWALFRAGRTGEAVPYAAAALRLGSQDPLALYHAGAIAAAHGDNALARQRLAAALALNPNFSPLWGPKARELLATLP